jgi:hypothetical protein
VREQLVSARVLSHHKDPGRPVKSATVNHWAEMETEPARRMALVVGQGGIDEETLPRRRRSAVISRRAGGCLNCTCRGEEPILRHLADGVDAERILKKPRVARPMKQTCPFGTGAPPVLYTEILWLSQNYLLDDIYLSGSG